MTKRKIGVAKTLAKRRRNKTEAVIVKREEIKPNMRLVTVKVYGRKRRTETPSAVWKELENMSPSPAALDRLKKRLGE